MRNKTKWFIIFFILKHLFKYTWKTTCRLKVSKERQQIKEIVREQEGGGGFSSKCSWDIQVSHSVDWSPVKLHLHPQISGETALIQHWSGVYFPLEPGARGSGLLISTTPKKTKKQKKHNKKAKIHHKHTVDEVLEELRYKNQSILFTWLLLSSDKHLGIVGLWGCIAHSCIVLTARLENSCFVVVFSLSFFFFLNHQKSLPAASVWICAHVCWREITGKLLPNQQQMYSS